MKRSLIISLIILVVGAVPAVVQRQRGGSLAVERDALKQKAAAMGIDTTGGPGELMVRAKRQREDVQRKAVSVKAEMLALARELGALNEAGEEPDDAVQQRATELLTRFLELDSGSIREVIEALESETGIPDEVRGDLVSMSILTLADDQPQVAVELYGAFEGLLKKNQLGEHVLDAALGNWAQDDPAGAVAWLRRQETENPELVGEEVKNSVLTGIAGRDPAMAFGMMDEVGLDDPADGLHAVMSAGAADDAERSNLLNAVRNHLNTISDPEQKAEMASKAMELLARGTDGVGFDSLSKWMDEAALSEKEKEDFASGLTWYTTKGETGRWVEWLSENLPGDQVGEPVKELVGEWTQQDHVATGHWLGTMQDGSAKTASVEAYAAAVEAYAAAVAEYEPEIATQWALTLPEGPARMSTFRAIYENWPSTDPEGAGKFAREHGLE